MPDIGSNTEFRKAPKWSDFNQADGIKIGSGPFIGIVKSNADPLRSGRLQVWFTELGGDPNDDSKWVTVNYCTPFYGVTNNRDGNDYKGSPHSYGMWFVPPDLGVKVLCTFINGVSSNGFWFACVPEYPNLHMIPAISAPIDGSSPAPVTDPFVDEIEPQSLGNPSILQKTPHDYQQQIWLKQGLLQDPDRGPGLSSAHRESPSAVFGISTPGRKATEGDPNYFTDPRTGVRELGTRGRNGGHTFVMDDGDKDGNSQMMRLRTANGHMIMMNDTKDFIYIINSKGSSWVEINSQGDINIYSESKINVAAQSEINFETKGALKLHGGTVDIKSDAALNIQGKDVNLLGDGSTKVTGKKGLHLKGMNTYLTGDGCIQIKGGSHIDLKGSCVTINTVEAVKAMDANEAKAPDKMPTREAWSGHQSALNPQAQATYGAQQNLVAGAAGKYGATNNYGSGTYITPSYGPLTNNIPPTVYNSGPQGTLSGQSSAAAQYVPANYVDTGQSYSVQSVAMNITYGTGASFDVAGIASNYITDQYSIGEQQNNPGNLQYHNDDKFAVGFAYNLAVYAKPEDGIAAMMVLFDSFTNNQPTTCAQLCQYYLQSSNITYNEVVSMARFIENLTGIGANNYVSLRDAATRISFASAVIQYVQGRIIYTYNQVLAGCAASLGVSPVNFIAQTTATLQPWQNVNNNVGFINPAKNSSISNNGSSPLTQIANRVISGVVGNYVNNLVNGGNTSNNTQHGSYGFVETVDNGSRDLTNTALNNGGGSGVSFVTTDDLSNTALYNGGGSGASFAQSPIPSAEQQAMMMGRGLQTTNDFAYTSVGRQNQPVVIDTAYQSYGRQNQPVVIDTAESRNINYTEAYANQMPQPTGAAANVPLPTPRPVNLNEPITNPNDVNSVIVSDPRKGEGTLGGGYNDPVQPTSTNTLGTSSAARPEYDPTTGQLINQPVSGSAPPPGAGSAAGGGGQGTPQGVDATGQSSNC